MKKILMAIISLLSFRSIAEDHVAKVVGSKHTLSFGFSVGGSLKETLKSNDATPDLIDLLKDSKLSEGSRQKSTRSPGTWTEAADSKFENYNMGLRSPGTWTESSKSK